MMSSLKLVLLSVLLVMAAAPMVDIILGSNVAHAEEAAAEAKSVTPYGISHGLIAIAAAFLLGLAAFGGAISQARTAHAALEGIARNPSASKPMFLPMILGLVFIETLVLFSFLIANNLAGKI